MLFLMSRAITLQQKVTTGEYEGLFYSTSSNPKYKKCYRI